MPCDVSFLLSRVETSDSLGRLFLFQRHAAILLTLACQNIGEIHTVVLASSAHILPTPQATPVPFQMYMFVEFVLNL